MEAQQAAMQAMCAKERKQMSICQVLLQQHISNVTLQTEVAEAELAEVSCAV